MSTKLANSGNWRDIKYATYVLLHNSSNCCIYDSCFMSFALLMNSRAINILYCSTSVFKQKQRKQVKIIKYSQPVQVVLLKLLNTFIGQGFAFYYLKQRKFLFDIVILVKHFAEKCKLPKHKKWPNKEWLKNQSVAKYCFLAIM